MWKYLLGAAISLPLALSGQAGAQGTKGPSGSGAESAEK